MTTISMKEVDFTKCIVTNLSINYGAQPISFISYETNPLIIETEPFNLTEYGIPMLHRNYCPNDSHREFIKIPFDPLQESCMALLKHFTEADNYFGSDEIKKKVFGSKWEKYVYHPIVRTPSHCCDEDENDSTDTKRKKPNYCKMKFHIMDNCSERINKTSIIDGNGKQIDCPTITSIAKHIKFNSRIQVTFKYTKIWANKFKSSESDKIMYAVGLTMTEIKLIVRSFDYIPPIYNLDTIKKNYKKFMENKNDGKKLLLTI